MLALNLFINQIINLMKLNRLIKTIEQEITNVQKSNPESTSVLKWDISKTENAIFDCGYYQGLQQAIAFIRKNEICK